MHAPQHRPGTICPVFSGCGLATLGAISASIFNKARPSCSAFRRAMLRWAGSGRRNVATSAHSGMLSREEIHASACARQGRAPPRPSSVVLPPTAQLCIRLVPVRLRTVAFEVMTPGFLQYGDYWKTALVSVAAKTIISQVQRGESSGTQHSTWRWRLSSVRCYVRRPFPLLRPSRHRPGSYPCAACTLLLAASSVAVC